MKRNGPSVSATASVPRGRPGMTGAILVEAAIALPLIALLILGLAQQYSIVLSKMDHVRLATEMTLGPQEPSIRFDRVSGLFLGLSNDPASVPTRDQFMNTVGDFFIKRATNNTTLIARIVYLTGDALTGIVSGYEELPTYTYTKGSATSCESATYTDQLESYAAAQAARMVAYRQPSNNASVPTLPKVFDVTVGGVRTKAYINYLPLLFALVCSEPVTLIWPQRAVSEFLIVPRRLTN